VACFPQGRLWWIVSWSPPLLPQSVKNNAMMPAPLFLICRRAGLGGNSNEMAELAKLVHKSKHISIYGCMCLDP
jgi:hypothetical protein